MGEEAWCSISEVVVVGDIHTHLRVKPINIFLARSTELFTHNSGCSRDLEEDSILVRRGSEDPSGHVVAGLAACDWDAEAEQFGYGRDSCPPAACGFEECSFEGCTLEESRSRHHR